MITLKITSAHIEPAYKAGFFYVCTILTIGTVANVLQKNHKKRLFFATRTLGIALILQM